jgi:hypothetical protein
MVHYSTIIALVVLVVASEKALAGTSGEGKRPCIERAMRKSATCRPSRFAGVSSG